VVVKNFLPAASTVFGHLIMFAVLSKFSIQEIAVDQKVKSEILNHEYQIFNYIL
jgi:hypothetical protein